MVVKQDKKSVRLRLFSGNRW